MENLHVESKAGMPCWKTNSNVGWDGKSVVIDHAKVHMRTYDILVGTISVECCREVNLGCISITTT